MIKEIYYVAFGDSLTSGVGASAEECSFPFQYFHSTKQTPHCRYINLGRSGMNSTELHEYICRPDIRNIWQQATDITITIGGNDLIRTYKQKGNILHFFVTIQKLKKNMRRILSDIMNHNPHAHVLMMGLYNPGVPEHPLYHRCNRLVRWVNHIYHDLAQKHNVDFINPYRHFLHQPHLLADEVHPNDNGYQLISSLFITIKKQSQLQANIIKQPVFDP